MLNMNLLQGNSLGDVSLESIEVMTKAQGEIIEIGRLCAHVTPTIGCHYPEMSLPGKYFYE